MKILFLSAHIYASKNKAGFHHLADAANRLKHNVFFCTVPNTPFNIIYELFRHPSRCWLRIKSLYSTLFKTTQNRIHYSTYFSLIYPMPRYHGWFKLKKLGFKYGFSRLFCNHTYDVIIVESCAGLLLIPTLKRKFPNATFIYRVSDCLEMLDSDPNLIDFETTILPTFDLVSTPISTITSHLQQKCPSAHILTHPHGINTDDFDRASSLPSPYNQSLNAIFIGMYPGIDWYFLDNAAQQFPNIKFHIFGPYKPLIKSKNIHYYGIIPFKLTLPYLVHASIGLYCVKKNRSNTDLTHFARSLKFMQYTYTKLPIIAPKAMQITEPHVFSYANNPTSIKLAIEKSLCHSKDHINTDHISSWDDLIQTLLGSSQ